MQHYGDPVDKITFFFDTCAKIEGLCAELYHYYSVVHQDHEYVSLLWTKTALEEENHKKQFELAYRLRDNVGFDLNADIDRINHIYQKMSKLLLHVRQYPPDIVTALTKAIAMEESLADVHLDSSVRFHDESIRRMFLALGEFDQEHIKSLRHCLAVMTLPQSEMVG